MVDLEEGAQETPVQQVYSRPFPPVNIRMLFQLYGSSDQPPAYYLRRMEQLLERRTAQADRALPPAETRRERLESRSMDRALYPQTAAEAGLRKLPAAQKARPDGPRAAGYPAEYPPLARTLRQPAGLIERTQAPQRQTARARALAVVADSTLLYMEKAPSEWEEPQRRFAWTPSRIARTAFRTKRSALDEEQAGRETAGAAQRYAAGGRLDSVQTAVCGNAGWRCAGTAPWDKYGWNIRRKWLPVPDVGSCIRGGVAASQCLQALGAYFWYHGNTEKLVGRDAASRPRQRAF